MLVYWILNNNFFRNNFIIFPAGNVLTLENFTVKRQTMKNLTDKNTLCSWLSNLLQLSMDKIELKWIPFELLFKWYSKFHTYNVSSSIQFARRLTYSLIEETKEYC